MTDTSRDNELPLSPYRVELSRKDLHRMLELARTLYRLSRQPGYRDEIGEDVPVVARFDPGHAAVMMGYDFHLTEEGPRLIEVNTNAGGGYLALLNEAEDVRSRFAARTLRTFDAEFRAWRGSSDAALRSLAILDELPEDQFLFPEMRAFARQLEARGISTCIVDPGELQIEDRAVYFNGTRIEMIYNRHCDFYLECDAMQGLRAAYLAGNVCLSPNPFSYALLADKRRLLRWRDRADLARWGLTPRQIERILEMVPRCMMLADVDPEELWAERKQWVFKPVTAFGSRGVLLGEKTTRTRFEQLDPATTLCQERVDPQMLSYPDGKSFKCDLRLFAYRDRLLGLTARLYRGQVTNMRTEGGGFARVVPG